MDAAHDFAEAQRHLWHVHEVDAEPFVVPVDGVGSVHGFEVGDGPPVLFVIGGGAPGAMWTPLVAELDGYRRVVVDRPGFGLTRGVPHRRQDMRRLARDFVGGIVAGLGLQRPAIVANSMGAWWSIQYVLAAPERIASLVPIGCPALLLGTSAPPPLRLVGVPGLGDLLVRLQPTTPSGARTTCRTLGDPLGTDPQDDAMAGVLAAMSRMPDFRRTWVDLLGSFVRIRGARPDMVITAEAVARLDVPVRFVWGESGDPFGDIEVGRQAAWLAPDADLVGVPGGHVPWLTDAAAVARPVGEFLATTTATT